MAIGKGIPLPKHAIESAFAETCRISLKQILPHLVHHNSNYQRRPFLP